jgi:hypothetical protein
MLSKLELSTFGTWLCFIRFSPFFQWEMAVVLVSDKDLLLSDIATKTTLAVSSIEFCQCTFEEGDIGIRNTCCGSERAIRHWCYIQQGPNKAQLRSSQK